MANEPNLYRRGKTWWGRVQVGGNERRRSLRTGDRVEARKRLKEWKEELDHARFYGQDRLTWKMAVLRFVQDVMPGAVKPKTAKRYNVSFRQVSPHLREKYIDTISRREIAAMIGARKKDGASNATIRRDLTAVSRVFAAAISWGACEHNPALEYDRSLVRERRDPIRLPTDAEITEAAQRAPKGLGTVILWARHTGMRENELITLTWSCVDLRRNAISLDRSKTDKPREIPLSPDALGTVTGTRRVEGVKLVLLHGKDGQYLNFPSQFTRWRKTNGVRFRFHDLRHKFAVEYLRGGGNIYDLQKILGHASIKTTEMYLNYLTPEEERQATGTRIGTGV